MTQDKGNRREPGTSTVGGKFNSIGGAGTQRANVALIIKLCGEIGVDGYATLDPPDRMFIDDTRIKLNQATSAMFGWRQVERMVAIHHHVMEARKRAEDGD